MYQEIVDLIRNAAISVNPNGTFIHGLKSDGSLEYDEPMPQIHLYDFVSFPQNGERGWVYSDMLMAFWGQDSPSSTPDERTKIIDEMFTLSANLLDTLDEGTVEIRNVRKERRDRALSGTLTGCLVTFRFITHTSPC